ncbi:MAG: VRR-NUC domain-containing protein [Hymenobacteraceae bacterium]|nr:VRR-NUC domain-containing protein [Hymenobacteraceae bacterium]
MKPPILTGQLPLEVAPPTAAEITRAILAYLTAHGYCAWRQPNRGEYDPTTGKWRPHPNARRGVPDIIGFRRSDAVFIGVEVKAGSDRLRPEQQHFLDQLKAAGGLPFIVRSFEEFQVSFEHRRLHQPSTS